MAILGVERVIFGVDDLDTCTRFWEDFGLYPASRTADESVFEIPSGSKVVIRKRDDPSLPTACNDRPGVRETTWGVDTQEALDALVTDLSRDRKVRQDPDGSCHFLADDGMALALRLWRKKPIATVPDRVNGPGRVERFNQHRQWRIKAIPKTINHVVFFSDDYVASFEFFRDRLNFRLSDHSIGVGAFARADGTNEHHSIFWVNTALPVTPGKPGFMHIAFGMDDIDEVMLGANIMERRGWKNTSNNSSGGISRHRISSAIYYYVDNPNGGEAEYHADTDYLDDNWVPRAWDFKFGSLLWAHSVPKMFAAEELSWGMKFDPKGDSLKEYQKSVQAAKSAPRAVKG
ncbi:MAG TPA: VOC family protein [Steroidobacteraceae bacterium]|nr:VOC family protein [Steroidobacteraceae bacterium]